MKEDTKVWLKYSEENLQSAKTLLKSDLYNPCLQNVQQCIEKSLKAILIETSDNFKRTHDVLKLKTILSKNGIELDITDDGCDFMNSIYLPSKYPLGSVLPDYDPGIDICNEAITIADKVFVFVFVLTYFKNHSS